MASRKRKPLSLKEKLNILAAVDRDPKRKRIDIARDLGLPASTVNTVVSKRKDIESNALVFSSATKQARGAKHGELEAALLNWFKQVRASGVNFDGSILWEKAKEIAEMLDIDDFTASNGRISRFRTRHGISYRQRWTSVQGVVTFPDDDDEFRSTIYTVASSDDPPERQPGHRRQDFTAVVEILSEAPLQCFRIYAAASRTAVQGHVTKAEVPQPPSTADSSTSSNSSGASGTSSSAVSTAQRPMDASGDHVLSLPEASNCEVNARDASSVGAPSAMVPAPGRHFSPGAPSVRCCSCRSQLFCLFQLRVLPRLKDLNTNMLW
ncbi:hypothetical protein HPB47_026299 [Ixodes persulcatus]|uniref:Uncharacterized protein n=1 Tax=Ixodes persulcatus TaxID=34615 RepID=A0AC60Q136_IXOPE|nr:hypothetical protein HPB47_026299 [Ixodes persulcatus]